MSLLDLIKKQTKKETVSENHPVCKLDFEGKFNYLRGLALFIVIDEKINENEKTLWKELIKIFNCRGFQEQLEEFLDAPDISELEDIMSSIKNNNVSQLFLLDALLICYSDADYAEKEKELLKVFNGKFGLTKQEIELLEKFAKNTSNKNYNAIVRTINDILNENSLKIDTEHLEYFLEDFEERKKMVKDISDLEVNFFGVERSMFNFGEPKILDTPQTIFDGAETTMIYTKVSYKFNVNKNFKYSLLIQLISPKKKLFKSLLDNIELQPDYCGAYRSLGYGFEETDNWEKGIFTAKTFIDGKYFTEKEFEITG